MKERIENVKLFTMEEDTGTIACGYVEFEDGKITDLGRMNGNGENGWLFPGLIDAHTHLGLIGDALNFEGDDVNETGEPVTPQLRGLDGLNPLDRCFSDARKGGVTAVMSGPGSANPIGGQFLALKTAGIRVDNMVIREPAAMKFALGENPKGVYHGKNQLPETRMATAALIRENLRKAQKYAQQLDAHNDPDNEDAPDEPDFDAQCEALIPVIRGEEQAHFHAHRADDIFTAIRLAKEFSLDYVLIHCTEGHLIADELAKEGARAIVGPNLCDRSKPELLNLDFSNPAKLDEAGVLVALTTDHTVTPVQYLPLCAALAVRHGMDFERAFRAVTVNPAKILGLEDRIGSIRPGKDADFALFDGDPMDLRTRVAASWIDGRRIVG